MNLVVTGGNGLVGSAFEDYIKLSSKELDLLNYDSSYSLLEKIAPEGIIHCAAKVGGLYHNIEKPATFFDKNIQLNYNVINIAKKNWCSKICWIFIYMYFP